MKCEMLSKNWSVYLSGSVILQNIAVSILIVLAIVTPTGITLGHIESCGITLGHLESCGITLGHLESRGITLWMQVLISWSLCKVASALNKNKH